LPYQRHSQFSLKIVSIFGMLRSIWGTGSSVTNSLSLYHIVTMNWCILTLLQQIHINIILEL
jgi:hypothetical protein